MERYFICFLSSAGLSLFLLFHRSVAFYEKKGFFEFNGAFSELVNEGLGNIKIPILLGTVGVINILSFVIFNGLLKNLEKRFLKRQNGKIIYSIGYHAVGAGISYSILFAIFSIFFIILDTSLINAWDISFLAILIGMLYVGTFFHFYYGVALAKWAAEDPKVELEKLKIDYEDLRLCFKYFVWAMVALLGGQVFVALRLKFEPFYNQPDKYATTIERLRPIMGLNVLQVAYLVLVAWATILSRFLRRMEEVKFKLKELNLKEQV